MPNGKATEYRIRSVVVCDDVRQEESGKQIIIGAYNRAIIFPSFPATLPQLVVHIAIEMIAKEATEFHFKVIDTTGEVKADIKRQFPEIEPNLDTIFNFKVRNPLFKEETRIDILFGIDRDPEVVATLNLRLPSGANELGRIAKHT